MKTGYLTLLVAFALSLLAISSLASEGTGSIKIGYTSVDEEGSLEVNQESFNIYEGFGLSLTDWNFLFDNGVTLQANLKNLTLNNRLLEAQVSKPGTFSFYANNNQYRRFYNFDGSSFTRRNMSNARFSFTPVKHVEFFGGYSMQDRHGLSELRPLSSYDSDVIDTLTRVIDYKQSRFSGGLKWTNKKSMVRAFYRGTTFDDQTPNDLDQSGDEINAVASTILDWQKGLALTAGYIYRKSAMDNIESELTTHQTWGAAKLALPDQWQIEYRMSYGIAERINEEDRTVDNIFNQVSLGKNIKEVGGLRVGYENRVQDDFIQKVTSSGFVIDGWLKPTEKLYFNGSFTTRSEDTDEGRRLLGDVDITRHQFAATYTDTSWGRFRVRWQQRIRENDPLLTEGLTGGIGLTTPETEEVNTRIEYSSLTPELTLRRAAYGSLTVSYSLITGSFENVNEDANYFFRDHVLTGSVTPRAVGPFEGDFSASYFRSKRDNDIEKFNLHFGLIYTFLKTHHLEARYHVYNFDDFRDLGNNYTAYYTGNIVEVNLIKDLSF